MRDKVTINLYSIETDDRHGYNRIFLDEFANIKKICDGLAKAATEAGKTSPEFVLSILLVPNWKRDHNSYTDSTYLAKKEKFLDEAVKKFGGIENIKVEDFYCHCTMTKEERAYMHNLKVMGSNADMIKTRAIINNADICRHLQLDSNTIVPSFKELYEQTFIAKTQKDGLNASFYDHFYVSAHNKMVYTTPGGEIHKNSKLEILLWEWCRDHQDDQTDKVGTKNSIYSKVFTKALSNIICTKEFKEDNGHLLYPATLNKNVYWLTSCMITAVNMSWSPAEEKEHSEISALKSVPAIKIGEDGIFNFQCFYNVLKKHTWDLRLHSKMLSIHDPSIDGEASRTLLLDNSNSALELQGIKEFYQRAIDVCPAQAEDLCDFIPNTEAGKKFTQAVFGMSLHELREQAKSITNTANSPISNIPTSAHGADKITEEHTSDNISGFNKMQ